MTADEQNTGDEPGFLERLPWYTVPGLLVGIPLLAALISQFSDSFYANIIWQYYWGPIKADAHRVGQAGMEYGGVTAFPGYNLVNTLSWAVLMGICVVGVAQIIMRNRIAMETRLIVGATMWVVAGAIFHVMQDARLFARPMEYFFITPIIYLMFAALGIVSMLIGVYLDRVSRQVGLERAMTKLWIILSGLVLVYLVLWLQQWEPIAAYLNPIWVALFAVITYALAWNRVMRASSVEPAAMTGILATGWLLMAVAYTIRFVDQPWIAARDIPLPPASATTLIVATGAAVLAYYLVSRQEPAKLEKARWVALAWAVAACAYIGLALSEPRGEVPRPASAMMSPILALALTMVVAILANKKLASAEAGSKAAEVWAAFAHPLNLLLIFSQMVDGFATALGLDLGGYSEKHVASAFVIDQFHAFALNIGWAFGATHPTFLAFAPLKFAVSLGVVYAIDIYSKEDAKQYPALIGMVKLAIIMVGIGPGVRDFVRLGLGV